MELKWEKSSTGSNAVQVTRSPMRGPVLSGLAYKMANDIEWVRAAFRGDWTGFEPYVRVWLKEGKDATGLTILMHNYPKDDEPNTLPDVCIRWAEWREQLAVQGFATADDKRLYVQDSLPLECTLRFYCSLEIGIDELMEQTSMLFAGGVPFSKVHRPEQDRRQISLEFCDGLLSYQFSFFPGSSSNMALEDIVQRWVDFARSLPHDYPPDEGFQIAYRESLWEQIARYDHSG